MLVFASPLESENLKDVNQCPVFIIYILRAWQNAWQKAGREKRGKREQQMEERKERSNSLVENSA